MRRKQRMENGAVGVQIKNGCLRASKGGGGGIDRRGGRPEGPMHTHTRARLARNTLRPYEAPPTGGRTRAHSASRPLSTVRSHASAKGKKGPTTKTSLTAGVKCALSRRPPSCTPPPTPRSSPPPLLPCSRPGGTCPGDRDSVGRGQRAHSDGGARENGTHSKRTSAK